MPGHGLPALEPQDGELTLSPNQRAWRRFRQNRWAWSAGLMLVSFIALVLVWPLFSRPTFAPYLPTALTWSPVALSDGQFEPPGWHHWFGTDVHGRDLLSRVVYGARISLVVGAVATVVSLLIGVCWGALSGYVGGRWDSVLMRIVDVLFALPSIVFVIVLMALLESPFRLWWNQAFGVDPGPTAKLVLLFVGLGSVSWLTMARIVRGQVLSLRHRGFVDAARVLGAGPVRIIVRHVVPNVFGVVVVYLTLTVPSVILYESFLSYLGLGVQPPQASLGYLLADGAAHINVIRPYWWSIVFPGGTLVLTLLALNLLGDGLRDAWDTQSPER